MANTITDFDSWLTMIDSNEYEDIYCLYKSVEEIDSYGFFEVQKAGGADRYFVKCNYFEDKLMLASEKARGFFLKTIENKYLEGMDIESWYGYKHAMEKAKDE